MSNLLFDKFRADSRVWWKKKMLLQSISAALWLTPGPSVYMHSLQKWRLRTHRELSELLDAVEEQEPLSSVTQYRIFKCAAVAPVTLGP